MRARSIAALCWIVATLPGMAHAQAEDEAHRRDRLETKRLNEAAARRLPPGTPRVQPAQPPAPAVVAPTPPSPAETLLRQREEKALADWRDHVAECRSGRRKGC